RLRPLFLTDLVFVHSRLMPRPPLSTLFPYTTLFRSVSVGILPGAVSAGALRHPHGGRPGHAAPGRDGQGCPPLAGCAVSVCGGRDASVCRSAGDGGVPCLYDRHGVFGGGDGPASGRAAGPGPSL